MAFVFIDLDGTLIEKGRPAKNALKAIRELEQNGHEPIIATGRVPFLAKELIEELEVSSYVLAAGTYIVYHGKLLLERPIKPESLQRIVEKSDEWKFDLVFEGTEDYVAYRKDTERPDQFSDYFGVKRPLIDKEYYLHHPIYALNVYDPEMIDRLREEFPEFAIQGASPYGYDVNLAGDLKAEGIEFLIHALGIKEEEVYAIGDGLNDVSMVKRAHTGIAMGNAKEEVKAVAQYITTSCSEGGVYDAMKHFKLI